MPGWTDAIGLIVRYAPELRRLIPVLERMVSPEAREEQRQRAAAVMQAAQRADQAAEQTSSALAELSRRMIAQNSELITRMESGEQRIKLLQADISALSERNARLERALQTTVLWSRILAGLVLAAIIGMLVMVFKKGA